MEALCWLDFVRRDGRHNGDEPLVESVDDLAGVDGDDLTDKPEVDVLAVDVGQSTAGEKPVVTGDAGRQSAVLIDERYELA